MNRSRYGGTICDEPFSGRALEDPNIYPAHLDVANLFCHHWRGESQCGRVVTCLVCNVTSNTRNRRAYASGSGGTRIDSGECVELAELLEANAVQQPIARDDARDAARYKWLIARGWHPQQFAPRDRDDITSPAYYDAIGTAIDTAIKSTEGEK